MKQDRITRERKGCIVISHVYIILYIELYNSYPASGKNQPNSFLFDILIFGTYGIREDSADDSPNSRAPLIAAWSMPLASPEMIACSERAVSLLISIVYSITAASTSRKPRQQAHRVPKGEYHRSQRSLRVRLRPSAPSCAADTLRPID